MKLNLPFIQLHVADYLSDTIHLTISESGAYLHLIMAYWQRQKPLPNNDRVLAAIAKSTQEEWLIIKASLEPFFAITETEWIHKRIDEDLLRAQITVERNRRAGQKSAAMRLNKYGKQPIVTEEDEEQYSGEGQEENEPLEYDSAPAQQASSDRSAGVQRPFNDRSTKENKKRIQENVSNTEGVQGETEPQPAVAVSIEEAEAKLQGDLVPRQDFQNFGLEAPVADTNAEWNTLLADCKTAGYTFSSTDARKLLTTHWKKLSKTERLTVIGHIEQRIGSSWVDPAYAGTLRTFFTQRKWERGIPQKPRSFTATANGNYANGHAQQAQDDWQGFSPAELMRDPSEGR